jgi:Plasmid pRiA4b ORF-3-like protein
MARTTTKTTTKTIEPKTSAAKSVVSLKVTLRGTKPPVWRRLLVPGALTLGDLHHAIQAAMGWHDSHLHAFDIDGRQYGDRSTVDDVADEHRLTLNSLMKSGIARFGYTYDFGDDWEHIIAIEKTQPALEEKSYPTCVAGARNCPPEDCGGCWGYGHLLEVLADPTHPEHAEQIEWIDEDFDPNEFSIENANVMLNARFNRK